MSLTRYIEKRNFDRTPEPRGATAWSNRKRNFTPRSSSRRTNKSRETKRPTFAIQLHDATRLHYDFRLEIEGVLKSWAVPKGMPTKKGERRLAMEVEDHPLEYGGFEGTIPEGNYGAGTVMLWDRGTYEVYGDDPLKAWQQGKLHFVLHGKKLQGEWTLVKMRPRQPSDKPAWLLLKSGADFQGELEDRSVLSGKEMDQIASGHGRIWRSSRPANGPAPASPARKRVLAASAKLRRSEKKEALSEHVVELLKKLPHEKPGCVLPMLALPVKNAPEEPDWAFEIKWDGYRALALKHDGKVMICSRRLREVTSEFPQIVSALEALPSNSFVMDGEIVALDETGHASFQRLQNFRTHPASATPNLYYYVFDVLNLEDRDLKKLPLERRKQILQAILQGARNPLRFSASLAGDPKLLLAQAKTNRLEGLIGKRRSSCYEPGRRTGAWVKVKLTLEQEFVIGGYTAPKGGRSYFGAIVVGYYQDGKLLFSSKVGSGFDESTLKALYDQFRPLKTNQCPFVNLPSRHPSSEGLSLTEMRRCTWIEPKLVCQVRFTEWTDQGGLRHPVYLGLRDDKVPEDVVREIASAAV